MLISSSEWLSLNDFLDQSIGGRKIFITLLMITSLSKWIASKWLILQRAATGRLFASGQRRARRQKFSHAAGNKSTPRLLFRAIMGPICHPKQQTNELFESCVLQWFAQTLCQVFFFLLLWETKKSSWGGQHSAVPLIFKIWCFSGGGGFHLLAAIFKILPAA